MAIKQNNDKDDMIPPPMAYAMEMYSIYLQSMMDIWRAYMQFIAPQQSKDE